MPYPSGMEFTEFLLEIGHRIRILRKERGLSQERLSELAGLHPVSMSNIECGKVNVVISTYFSLAKALDVELADLLDTATDADNGNSWHEMRTLFEKSKKLDAKKRAVYLDAVLKLFERIESI